MLWTIAKILLAVGAAYVLLRIGFAILGSFARPVPEPPPEGELRKVDLRYRCSICAAEVRMTRASEDLPPPPRHCQEDMELVAPIE
jgi:hypothetical protein